MKLILEFFSEGKLAAGFVVDKSVVYNGLLQFKVAQITPCKLLYYVNNIPLIAGLVGLVVANPWCNHIRYPKHDSHPLCFLNVYCSRQQT